MIAQEAVASEVINEVKYDELCELKCETFLNVLALENSTDIQDQIRFKLFSELLARFTENVTESHLTVMIKRYPGLYRDDCQHLHAFHLEFETMENHNWIRKQFPSIKRAFHTPHFSKTLQTKWLVTNVVRHAARWLNEHYQFRQKIIYHNVEMTWKRTTSDSKIANISFLAF